jgi:hypothetical protein
VAIEIRRNLYKRGSSFETTIPMPLLFAIEKDKKYNVIFRYNNVNNRWYLSFEKIGENGEGSSDLKKGV